MSRERSIRRALLSVSDKTGVMDFARALADQGVEIVSTGGTARTLRDAGISIIQIDDFTGFPEILDGRVKTLHPRVHAGLLFRRDDPTHVETMESQKLAPIDLVAVNLYPFEATVAREGVTYEDTCKVEITLAPREALRISSRFKVDKQQPKREDIVRDFRSEVRLTRLASGETTILGSSECVTRTDCRRANLHRTSPAGCD